MAMSEGEIRGLIEKLKRRYGEHAKKNPTWFNVDAFNERFIAGGSRALGRPPARHAPGSSGVPAAGPARTVPLDR